MNAELARFSGGARIEPEDRRHRRRAARLDEDGRRRLTDDADRGHVLERCARAEIVEGALERLPPAIGRDLGPAWLRRVERAGDGAVGEQLAARIEQRGAHAGRPDVDSEEAHAAHAPQATSLPSIDATSSFAT